MGSANNHIDTTGYSVKEKKKTHKANADGRLTASGSEARSDLPLRLASPEAAAMRASTLSSWTTRWRFKAVF
jgi:hypothetical protein